jgi:MFS family permease
VNRPIRWYDFITINSYWFGLTALSQTMTPLVLPLLVQQFVGSATQGAAYGQLRLWTLMVAVLVQALMGMVSDRSTSPIGRRRPFIMGGTLGVVLILVLVGFSTGLEGITGYWVLFGLIILMMVFGNTAHAAQQGLIPDLVPVEKHGRFSGIKAIFEVPLPVIVVAFTIGRLVAAGNLWGALLVLIGLLLLVMVITMFVKEKAHKEPLFPFTWQPFLRLALMTAAFTMVILLIGQLLSWGGRLIDVLQPVPQTILYGIMGLLSMGAAVVIGVGLSIRIGLDHSHSPVNRAFTWWVISRLAFLIGSTNIASFLVFFCRAGLVMHANKLLDQPLHW